MGSIIKPKVPKIQQPQIVAPTPAPVVPPAPTVADTPNATALEDERKRRKKAAGTAGNIVSSLAGAPSDAGSASAKSSLLGG